MRKPLLQAASFLPRAFRDRLRYWVLRLVNPQRYQELQALRKADDTYSLRPFEKHRCIFVHLPKCAGVSVNRALFGGLGGGHLTIVQYSFAFSPAEFDEFFKFTIVRHPLDRLVSAFFFLKNGGFEEKDRAWSEEHLAGIETFDEFVTDWLTEERIWSMVHFFPQYWYLQDCWGELRVDFIGRLENLENDFRRICETLNIQAKLPHSNSSKHDHYRDYYNSRTVQKVTQLYAQDMALFGYHI
jgi:hypothetical protein